MKFLVAVILPFMVLQGQYRLETQNFHIQLPAKPIYRTQVVDAGTTNLTLHLYILEHGTTYYVVAHSYYPSPIDLSNKEHFFQGVISGMIANYQGVLLSEKSKNVFGAFCKEVQVKLPEGDIIEVHYYLKERTLFQVLVKASSSEIQSEQVRSSFESFKLL